VAHQGVGHAIALGLEHEQVPVVDEPVDHSGGHLLVGEYAAPLGELQVGRQDQALALVTVGDDPEQELRSLPVNGDVSPFIQDPL